MGSALSFSVSRHGMVSTYHYVNQQKYRTFGQVKHYHLHGTGNRTKQSAFVGHSPVLILYPNTFIDYTSKIDAALQLYTNTI